MKSQIKTSTERAQLDLRGVKCPLNWAHTKVRLEQMTRGQVLEVVIDDARGVRDIPVAAEAEGYSMLATDTLGDGAFLLRIER